MRTTICGRDFCAVMAVLGSLTLAAPAQDLWLEGGPVVRGAMRVKITGSSYVQRLGLHDPSGATALTTPGGIGPANAYADRTYDNGYVKKDPGTGVSPLDPNTTWNWGFNNPNQYNSSAQTLMFQKQGAAGFTTLANGPARASDELLGEGLQLRAGMTLTRSGNLSVDVALGFQAVFGRDTKINTTTYQEDVRRITVIDTYNTSGIGGFPSQGFQGTYLGPFDNPPVVPSPVIPNKPSSRVQTTSSALSGSQNNISFNVDQNLYQVSLGPQVGYAVGSRLKLNFRPTISLNILDADVKRTEVFVQSSASGGSTLISRWSEQGGQCKVFLGFGAIGGADLDLGKGYYAGIFGGYEWAMEKANVAIGPNAVSLDSSGFVAGAQVGKRF